MSRLQLLSVCAGLSFCFFLSCRASQNSLAQPQAFVGQVYVIGNEPFAKLALKLADGQTYVLDCTKEIESTLRQLQGQTVRLIAKTGAKKPEGQSLQVVQAEAVKKE
jgi:hypothetical protein